jgi:hypothetical protein
MISDIIKILNIKKEVALFLWENQNPPDEMVHDWAESKGYNKHLVERLIYQLATSYVVFLHSGVAAKKGFTIKDMDPEEFKKGLVVEAEHSDDPLIKEKIILDHGAEFDPKPYYSRLGAMEETLKKE